MNVQKINRHNELVVIDSNITDIGTILDGLTENQMAVILSDGSGINELLSCLDGAGIIWDAMHFITHGRDGLFSLNGDTISLENLDTDKWTQLGSFLSNDGDILLYGCNIAASDNGKRLIDALASATGADVAASDDITGMGGDWDLETQSGIIGTGILSPDNYAQSLYEGRIVVEKGESREVSDETFSGNTTPEIYFLNFGGAVENLGHFKATNCTFSLNTASNGGGAIGTDLNSSTEVYSCTFCENTTPQNGGAIWHYASSLTVTNSTFRNNSATDGGAVFNNQGTFTAKADVFDGNSASKGGAVNNSGGTFTADGSMFSTNTATKGGAVFNESGTFTASSGSTFSNNSASNGGAVDNVGDFTANDSTFSKNTATETGGAVNNSGTFTANTSAFSGNSAKQGGGAVYNSGTFTTTGSTFDGNSASNGGAVNNSGGTFTATGSTFDGNSASNGGAVNNSGGTFTANSDTFSGNKASKGGAVYNIGAFTANNSTFSENTATETGGAVYNEYGTFTANSDTFSGNKANQGGAVNNAGGVTAKASVFDGNSASNGGAVYNSNIFTADGSTFSRNTASNGGAVFNSQGSFTANTSTFNGNSATNGGAVYNQGSFAANTGTFSGNSATENGGAVYVYSGVFTADNSTFDGNTATNGGAVFNVESSTVTNSTFDGNKATEGGAVYNSAGTFMVSDSTFNGNSATYGGAVDNSGTFTANSGTFSNNTATNGGAVYNSGSITASSSSFRENKAIHGGAVYNNLGLFTANTGTFNGNSASSGGAVYNSGTFAASSSTFSENTASATLNGGGGAVYNSGTFTANTSAFSGNKAYFGGAVLNDSGTFAANTSTFSGNSATENGGAVFNNESGVFTATASVFDNNSAFSGGAVRNENSTFTAIGSTFSKNKAVNSGGAVHNSGTFTASDSMFNANTAKYGGAVLNDSGTFTATSSIFSGNAATLNGGAVLNTGTFTANIGTFSNNTATETGGAVYNSGTFTVSDSIFSGNKANQGGAIYQQGGSLTICNSSFQTASDTIYLADGSATFGGKISLAGNLYSKNAITVDDGTEIIFDLSSCTAENSVAIITDLDKILNPDCGTAYSVNISATQPYGKYLLATGASNRTISVVCNGETLAAAMNVGELVQNPLDPAKCFLYSLDSTTGNLYFEVLEKPDGPIISVSVTPESWTNTDVTVSAEFIPLGDAKITLKQYSTDGTTWTDYTGEFFVDTNKTVYFKTTDNAGNVTEKTIEITNIDKIKPTITVTQKPTDWTNQDVTLEADFADEGGSKLKDAVFSYDNETWTEYTVPLVIDMNKTVYFKATDNAGNVTEKTIEITNIDKIKPTITVKPDSTDWTSDPVILAVTFDGANSGMAKCEYSFDGLEWTECSENEDITCNVNTYVYFHGIDRAGNFSEANIEVRNITEADPEPKLTVYESQDFAKNLYDVQSFDVRNNVTVTAYGLKMQKGSAKLTIADDSTMIMSELFAHEEGSSTTVTLKKYVSWIVRGDVQDMVKLTAGDNSTVTVEGVFQGAEKATSVSFGKYSYINLNEVDLKEGKNSFTLGSASTATVGNVRNVNKLTLSNGIAKNNKTDAPHVLTSLTAAGNITGSAFGDTFSFGNDTEVKIAGDIDLTEDGSDTVKIGKNSIFTAANILFSEKVKSKNSFTLGSASTATVRKIENVNKLTISNGIAAKADDPHEVTGLIAATVTGSAFGDTFSFGNDTEVKIAGDIDLNQDGSDTVKIGKNSIFTATDVLFSEKEKSKNSFTLGSASTATIGNVLNVNKLTLSNGIAAKADNPHEVTGLTAATVTGSAFGDTFSFGNDTDVKITGNIDLTEDGSDTVKIGKNSFFTAMDVLFSEKEKSKNSFTLGSASTATVRKIENVNKLTLSNGIAKNNKTEVPPVLTSLTATTVTGSKFNDTLSFGNDTEVKIAGDIDLNQDGSDTVKIGKNSIFTAANILFSEKEKSKNSFSLGSASTATVGNVLNVNKLTLSNGIAKNNKTEAPPVLTSLTATTVTGSKFNDTLSFGNDTEVKITGDIDLNQDGSDTVKIGKNSNFTVGNITFNNRVKSKNSFSLGSASTATVTGSIVNVNKLTLSNGAAKNNKTGASHVVTGLTATGITGSIFNDTLSFGNDTEVKIAGDIDLNQDGSDTVKIGKNSTFTTDDITFNSGIKNKNTFSLGSASTATITGSIVNLNKLTISNGIAENEKKKIGQQYTTFTADNIGCSRLNDTISFGSDTKVNVWDRISLDEGDDTLKIGNSAIVEIGNFDDDEYSLDFGDGKDTLTIGKGSAVRVGKLNVGSLDKLTIGAESTLYLGAESFSVAQKQWSEYVEEGKIALWEKQS